MGLYARVWSASAETIGKSSVSAPGQECVCVCVCPMSKHVIQILRLENPRAGRFYAMARKIKR